MLNAYGEDGVDVGLVKKICSRNTGGRYSPRECIDCKKEVVVGDSDTLHIGTSHHGRSKLIDAYVNAPLCAPVILSEVFSGYSQAIH
jgi:hypothetical protein